MKNLITLLILLCSAFVGKSQVTANFTFDVIEDCGFGHIQFNDASTNAASYDWDFGDGSAHSQQASPVHIYNNPGLYSVTLVATNGADSDTEVKSNIIQVFVLPTASFSVDNTSGCFPLNVNFTDESIDGDGTINDWFWTFGDANSSTDQNPAHTYNIAGSFDVSLFVTDDNGCQGSSIMPGLIDAQTPPVSNFNVATDQTCDPTLNTVITNVSTGSNLSYLWDYGDGSATSNVVNPGSHFFNGFGTYIITLTVTNDIGCSVASTHEVNLIDYQVNFSVTNPTICGPGAIIFDDNSDASTTDWDWDFGDGSPSATIADPAHFYPAVGVYDVSVTVTNGIGCTATASQTNAVTIQELPEVGFEVDDQILCSAPYVASFTDTSDAAVEWLWTFAGFGTSTDQNPTITYPTEGIFDVTLEITDAQGCVNSVTMSNYMDISDPIADFIDTTLINDPLPFDGCAPLTVDFNAFTYSNDAVINYSWDFGDGNNGVGINPTNVYALEGLYDVTINITTTRGCVATRTREEAVQIGSKPNPDFTWDPDTTCVGNVVAFTNLSTNSDAWEWNFGAITNDTTFHTTTFYSDTGRYNVTLTAFNLGCDSTLIEPLAVYVMPPASSFGVDPQILCSAPYIVSVTDESRGADTWEWSFGDGATFSGQTPGLHTYSDPGDYTIFLEVTNFTTGCIHGFGRTVTIPTLFAGFEADTTVGCDPSVISFSDTSTTSSGISLRRWDFGDGTVTLYGNGTITGFGNTGGTYLNPNHIYSSPGFYDVTLITQDANGCMDTAIYVDYIEIKELPSPDFTVDNASGCAPLTVNFTDQTTGGGNLIFWSWDFGDGTVSNDQNPSYTFQNSLTNFPVSLSVIDEFNCAAVTSITTPISSTFPVAIIQESNLGTFCDSSDVFLNGQLSQGVGLNYLWDFGDGTATSIASNITHEYSAPAPSDTSTTFAVSLTTTDINGCVHDTLAFVTIEIPVANFTAATTTSDCPPFPAVFQDSSISVNGVFAWNWTFGDGGGSTIFGNTATHTYSTAGVFDVSLEIVTNNGCRDTIRYDEMISVGGPSGSFDYTIDSSGCYWSVDFDATTLNADTILWNYGDGTEELGEDVTHEYTYADAFQPTMILIDTNGCVVPITTDDLIIVPPPPPITTFITEHENCENTDGSIAATPTTGTTPYTYQWSNNQTTQNITNLDDDTYFLTVTDAQGCDSTYMVQVLAIFPNIEANFSVIDRICLDSNGTVSSAPTGGETPYSYVWTNGQTGLTSTGLSAGYHVITITALYNCTEIDSALVGTLNPILEFDVTMTEENCTNSDGSLAIDALGGQTPYSYTWFNTSTIQSLSNLSAGNYAVSVSDSHGCAGDSNIAVTAIFPTFTSAFNTTNPTCFQSDGATSVIINGGTGPYNILWSTAATGPTLSNIAQGTYQLTVTDIFNCLYEPFVVVAADFPTLSSTDTTNNSVCENFTGNGGITGTTGGTAPYTYVWQDGTPGTTLSGLHYGTYLVSVTDFDGCPGTHIMTISADYPSTSAGFSTFLNTDFNDVGAIFTDSSSATHSIIEYHWSFGDSTTYPSLTDTVVSHIYNTTGSFAAQLVIVDTEGCVDTTIQIIDINPSNDILIPNVFTPNGDGSNDYWRVVANGVIDYDLTIVNRWGQILFKTDLIGYGWDGNTEAFEPAPEGTYFFILNYAFNENEPKTYSGTLTLFR